MNLITNEDVTVFPYNDASMVYDLDSRQYLLTVSGVSNLLGQNLETLLGTHEEAVFFNQEISDMIYNFIYSHAKLPLVKHVRYRIAKDEDIRFIFQRILLAQTRYAIRSGANLLGDMHGVNIEKSKSLDINSLRGNVEISSQAHRMLLQTGLLYTGFAFAFDFDDDGSF